MYHDNRAHNGPLIDENTWCPFAPTSPTQELCMQKLKMSFENAEVLDHGNLPQIS